MGFDNVIVIVGVVYGRFLFVIIGLFIFILIIIWGSKFILIFMEWFLFFIYCGVVIFVYIVGKMVIYEDRFVIFFYNNLSFIISIFYLFIFIILCIGFIV